MKIKELFEIIWNAKGVPKEFKDATNVHLYKSKGNRQCCDNHRGIYIISIAGKILARVLLSRLLVHLVQERLPESQYVFRKGLYNRL